MAEALFLDGPLAGQTRDVPEAHYDQHVVPSPSPLFSVQSYSGTWDAPHYETVTYRRKPNRLSYGPRWVFAVGDKVGEQVVSCQAFTPEAIESMGVDMFEQMITYQAEKALNATCSAEGLVVAEVHEVWRGSRRDAIASAYLQNPDGVKAAAALQSVEQLGPLHASMLWVVFEGVAVMPT
ncbi:hypothetical protein SEA_CHRIS_89 [Mycobacterium phage Chris]|uniref:Uncharacterized protein n=1 Tax=Mycobacterium phage Chris TaxID=2725626 RepID=A0A6M3T8X2_9CAUD|nr:hypothetical protein I5G96_gp016 [Mycobacterium phage Chris]QJD50491.1 hypothetical protein SEA_CHRIS_89 [Mycobacterium phage Chris]